MTPIAHHGGEALILTAAIGSGLSGWLLLLRLGTAELARLRRRRRR